MHQKLWTYLIMRFEQIARADLQPKYNGSPQELIPPLNMIHIQCQNDALYTATFLTQDQGQIDLVQQFSQVRLDTVQNKAKWLWDSPTSLTQ